jgi:hypothetical protein
MTIRVVVEEKLANGAAGWQEVSLLAPKWGPDQDNIQLHLVEKCCNKYKKPTGNPGGPKRDMILRC